MKKTTFATRVLLLLLTLAMFLAVLAGCQATDDTEEDTTDTQSVTDALEEESTGLVMDDLPDDLKFNETLTILGSKGQSYHYMSEGESDDVINNVIFRRNATVEERLGLELNFILEPGSFNEKDSFMKLVEAQNQGGTPYDAVICYNLLPYAMAMKGLCDNLFDTTYIDLSAPWWPQSYLATGVYEEQIFGLVESCSYGTLERMICTFFNEDLIKDYPQIESPYDLVANNQWTFDKLISMTKDTYQDLNTDGKKDKGDFFGFCAGGTSPMLDSWFFALGNRYSKINGDGDLELLLGAPEVSNFFEAFNQVFESNDNVLWDENGHTKMFTAERVLFYNTIVGMTSQLKETDIVYGAVPTPKASSEQAYYYTHLGNTHDAWCIPTGVKDMDCSSAMIECMASESYRQTNPVYFENQLKLRYAQDERVAAMYDLIRDSISFDFCYLYAVAFTDATRPNALISKCITSPTKNNWSSVWGSNKTVVEEQFNSIVNSYFK